MANRLRFWRKRAGLTQHQLAERADLSHVQVSRLERGVSFFSRGSLERLAKALSVEPKDIVPEEEVEDAEVAEASSVFREIPTRDRPRAIAILRTFVSQG